MGKGEGKRRMGWIPDYPDFRDYTEKTGEIKEALGAGALPKTKGLPASVDLREWCSPVEDQKISDPAPLRRAPALSNIMKERPSGDTSKLLGYSFTKSTRNLMKMKGDTGGFLRTTMGAMVLFGVPPEEYWPYTDDEARLTGSHRRSAMPSPRISRRSNISAMILRGQRPRKS